MRCTARPWVTGTPARVARTSTWRRSPTQTGSVPPPAARAGAPSRSPAFESSGSQAPHRPAASVERSATASGVGPVQVTATSCSGPVERATCVPSPSRPCDASGRAVIDARGASAGGRVAAGRDVTARAGSGVAPGSGTAAAAGASAAASTTAPRPRSSRARRGRRPPSRRASPGATGTTRRTGGVPASASRRPGRRPPRRHRALRSTVTCAATMTPTCASSAPRRAVDHPDVAGVRRDQKVTSA